MLKKQALRCAFLVLVQVTFLSPFGFAQEEKSKKTLPEPQKGIYGEYVSFFERVYNTMDQNYYMPVNRKTFDVFINRFDNEIYGKSPHKEKKSNFILWRSAAYLVDDLKAKDDIFSAFMPPKPAKEFAQKVLGQKIDLGIEGKLIAEGFLVARVEPRSDAYLKGLRSDDIIVAIDGKPTAGLEEKAIQDLLTPLVDTKVQLAYVEHGTKIQKTIEVVSQEYYKQTVFMIPIDIPRVYCLQIQSFNRKTSEDMFNFLSVINKEKDTSLIIDLRGNPGGPPLAAQELSAFFLTPGQALAYFQKKGHPKAMLKVPEIPEDERYSGPIAILVNKGSGSASELFSGILQKYRHSVLVGGRTAGKVLLKSMFDYDDGSMVLLVTARGYFADDSVFDFQGLMPDYLVEDEKADLIHLAAEHLKEAGTTKK